MLKKVLISCILVVLIMACTLSFNVYAAVAVTADNLRTSINNILSIDELGGKYTATIEGNNIKVSSGAKEYNIQYNLSGNPTFTYTIPINSETTYEDFADKTKKLIMPMAGYLAVANIQGLSTDDCLAYLTILYAMGTFNGFNISSSDEQKASFEQNKIDYVKNLYQTKKTVKDNTIVGINSFELSTELKDVTDTSCNIVCTVSVDTNANFATLSNDTSSDGDEQGADSADEEEQNVDEHIAEIEKKTEELQERKPQSGDTTQATKAIPQTGSKGIMAMSIIAIIAVAVISFINVKRYKDIK